MRDRKGTPISQPNGHLYAAGMAGLPIAVAIATGMFAGLLVRVLPRLDERYVSLLIGIPWTIAAWLFAIHCRRRGLRALAMLGGIFWTCCALLAAWVTLAFWHG